MDKKLEQRLTVNDNDSDIMKEIKTKLRLNYSKKVTTERHMHRYGGEWHALIDILRLLEKEVEVNAPQTIYVIAKDDIEDKDLMFKSLSGAKSWLNRKQEAMEGSKWDTCLTSDGMELCCDRVNPYKERNYEILERVVR